MRPQAACPYLESYDVRLHVCCFMCEAEFANLREQLLQSAQAVCDEQWNLLLVSVHGRCLIPWKEIKSSCWFGIQNHCCDFERIVPMCHAGKEFD